MTDTAAATDNQNGDRMTAPQQPYSSRDVSVGVAVLAVGLVITFVIPLLLG